tara:strand:+ start:536 stop:757 length:222 start_codon:yes stop_codon:yes gene_type:complete
MPARKKSTNRWRAVLVSRGAHRVLKRLAVSNFRSVSQQISQILVEHGYAKRKDLEDNPMKIETEQDSGKFSNN